MHAISSSRSGANSRSFLGQCTFVQPDEEEKIVSEPIRHFNGIHDSAARFIMAAQIIDFMRQVVLDGSPDAFVEKFRRVIGLKRRQTFSICLFLWRSVSARLENIAHLGIGRNLDFRVEVFATPTVAHDDTCCRVISHEPCCFISIRIE